MFNLNILFHIFLILVSQYCVIEIVFGRKSESGSREQDWRDDKLP